MSPVDDARGLVWHVDYLANLLSEDPRFCGLIPFIQLAYDVVTWNASFVSQLKVSTVHNRLDCWVLLFR